jgi:DNA replication and repair protein RecF
MIIENIKINNLRSHAHFSSEFSEKTTIITGPNGSGKTSVLEAISVALQGRSFKGVDRDMLRSGDAWWKIEIINDEDERVVKYQPESNIPKQFIVDNKQSIRLPAKYKYPVVLFEPDDLRLLHGSPARRRKFIDTLAAQLYSGYSQVLGRYERTLQQRNKLLKNETTQDLFAWNVSLAKYGALIINTRAELIDRIDKNLRHVYNRISETGDSVVLRYPIKLSAHNEQRLLNELESQVSRDRALGYTSVGPHRHDIEFEFNHKAAADTASRGETRTIILALKFLEVDLLEEAKEKKPIILLDDVFSELDESRQLHLATNFKDHQIIMTSVDAPKILKSAEIIELKI